MKMNEYQEMSKRTMPIKWDSDVVKNFSMGLCGEAGELVDLLKKSLFHGHHLPLDKFIKEAGDVMFYLTGLASLYNVELEEIATVNLMKLYKRYPNGFSVEDSIRRVDEEC